MLYFHAERHLAKPIWRSPFISISSPLSGSSDKRFRVLHSGSIFVTTFASYIVLLLWSVNFTLWKMLILLVKQRSNRFWMQLRPWIINRGGWVETTSVLVCNESYVTLGNFKSRCCVSVSLGFLLFLWRCLPNLSVWFNISIYKCMHICVSTCAFMYLFVYVCVCARLFVMS